MGDERVGGGRELGSTMLVSPRIDCTLGLCTRETRFLHTQLSCIQCVGVFLFKTYLKHQTNYAIYFH